MRTSRVIFRKASYDYATLKPLIFEMADYFCPHSIRSGSRVVIKPNLLAPAPPDRAIVTNPLVVRGVAEYLLQRGARVSICDSQAMGTFQKVLKESGLKDALKGLDVECREFGESVKVDIGEPFGAIEIARDVMEADAVVNLPKLKTHAQMLMTLGVKNLFGCIVGLRKPQWHFRTGVSREMFAHLLVSIHKAVKPAFTLIDGILAMEGEGPGRSGTPRELGLLAASDDAIALDISICTMLGPAAERLFTNAAAKQMGLAPDDIELSGEIPGIRNFKFPEIVPVVFGPKGFHGFMRRHLVQRPVPEGSLCRMCGECWKYCPAKAITHDRERIHFDYDRCIRCYCCIEVCPHGALRAEEPLVGRAIRKMKGL
jgi:uncharacterized protein (DUF362 family)/Pyruvate/2-oxoacid:ferredoxin oxidoreductase delta subunit